uniref:protein boule-like n=1 Tax=Ciona intestinalis TaxID=7719 RepID=UPI000180C88A|nr:protein boule-like [Ciona intestinalis]|eukprot:XP_026690771.1 protein boule-like [Ciona intestinalis]
MEIVSCGYKSVVTIVTNNDYDGPVQGVNNFVSNRIFLSGFDDQTTEYEIKKAFAEFGTITQTKLMKPPGKRPYGFLTFEDSSSCKRVLKLKDEMLFCIRGRDVQICPAWYKPKKSGPTFENTVVAPASTEQPPVRYVILNGTTYFITNSPLPTYNIQHQAPAVYNFAQNNMFSFPQPPPPSYMPMSPIYSYGVPDYGMLPGPPNAVPSNATFYSPFVYH